MAIELKSLTEVVRKSYANYYEVYEDRCEGIPIVFRADYFGHGMKSIFPLVGDEYFEFVYFFSSPDIDEFDAEKCLKYALDDATSRIHPNKNLRSADIKAVFISDEYTAEALHTIRTYSYEKKYEDAFFAKTRFITCAADVNDEKVWTNAYGREMASYFKSLFRAQHKE